MMANRVRETREPCFGNTVTNVTAEEEVIEQTAATEHDGALFHLLNALDILAAEGQLDAGFRVSALITELFGSERGGAEVVARQAKLLVPGSVQEIRDGLRTRWLAAEERRQYRSLQLEQMSARAEAMVEEREKEEWRKDEVRTRQERDWAETVRQSRERDLAEEGKEDSENSGGEKDTAFSGGRTEGAESATEYSE